MRTMQHRKNARASLSRGRPASGAYAALIRMADTQARRGAPATKTAHLRGALAGAAARSYAASTKRRVDALRRQANKRLAAALSSRAGASKNVLATIREMQRRMRQTMIMQHKIMLCVRR